MNNNTNQTSTGNRGNKKADFKPKRRNAKKEHIGLGVQPIGLKNCEYGLSAKGVELVKLEVEHLNTGVIETFNFINGSIELEAVMDVIDPTGEIDIDFKDYIGERMSVEVVEAGIFRNIINAWAIAAEEDEQVASIIIEESNEEGDDYDYDQDEPEDEDLDLSELLSDGEED